MLAPGVAGALALAAGLAPAGAQTGPAPAGAPGHARTVSPAESGRGRVTLGIENLLGREIERVAGKKLGLITNPSGVDGELVSSVDRLARDERVQLVQLYAPEHGIRGDVPAGEQVGSDLDPRTRIPVESLYGGRKAPSPESLARIDLLLFDIQDVGSRTYTYVSTLGEAMRAAAEARVPVLVLDRPNPLGGLLFEGPLREERWKSFIGWGPLPISHGMTVGELAFFYERELELGCELGVVTMSGWRRAMVWEDTGLDWVPTSPHIPHARQAHLYIATGMIGGTTTNINEGVGSTLPFETIAAEFVDADELCAALRGKRLPGLRWRPIHYTPRYGGHTGRMQHGVQLVLTDPRALLPLRTALTILCTLEALYPGEVEYVDERGLGIHWGNTRVAELARAGKSPLELEATWRDDLAAFAKKRAAVLLYE